MPTAGSIQALHQWAMQPSHLPRASDPLYDQQYSHKHPQQFIPHAFSPPLPLWSPAIACYHLQAMLGSGNATVFSAFANPAAAPMAHVIPVLPIPGKLLGLPIFSCVGHSNILLCWVLPYLAMVGIPILMPCWAIPYCSRYHVFLRYSHFARCHSKHRVSGAVYRIL